jgi:hypothetical protein
MIRKIKILIVTVLISSASVFGNWFSDAADYLKGNDFGVPDDKRNTLYNDGWVDGYIEGRDYICFGKIYDKGEADIDYDTRFNPEYMTGYNKGMSDARSTCKDK